MKKKRLTPQSITFTILFLAIPVVGFITYQLIYKNKPMPTSKHQAGLSTEHLMKTSGAYQALEHYSFQRSYPYNTIPLKTYTKEVARYSRNGARFRTKQTSTWTSLGPHNKAGRTLAICLNPQKTKTIYLGTAGGGLWRSHTGGEGKSAWTQVATGFPIKAVASIAIPKEDSSTIYVGTGEVYRHRRSDGGQTDRTLRGTYGLGILKSTDAGATWTQSLSWPEKDITGVQKIRINPKKSQTVMAATTEGVYISYNSGTSWANTLNVPMVTDLLINAQDTTQILAACGNFQSENYGLYRSTDGGKNWSKVINGFPAVFDGKVLLSASAASADTVYASVGAAHTTQGIRSSLYVSADRGISWTLKSTSNYAAYQFWFSHYAMVHNADPTRLLAGGVDMFRFTNSGDNIVKASDWRLINFTSGIGEQEGTKSNYAHADHHEAVSDPNNPDVVYLATDGGVFRTDDFGVTYRSLNGGLQNTQFYSIASGQNTNSILWGGLQDNGSFIYQDNKTWHFSETGDGMKVLISPSNDQVIFDGRPWGAIRKSTDGGQTFGNFFRPVDINPIQLVVYHYHFKSPCEISPVNNQVMYAGSSVLAKSVDLGETWVKTTTSPIQDTTMPVFSMGLSHHEVNTVAVATAPSLVSTNLKPQVFITNNGGTFFTNITAGLPDRIASQIEFDPNDANTLYVVFSGFDSGHVYRSKDKGNTWEDISGNLPNVPHADIFVPKNMPGLLFVGNDIGVFVSRDGGKSWENFNNGLPYPANVEDIAYNSATNKMQIGTHGNGVFETSLDEFYQEINLKAGGADIVNGGTVDFGKVLVSQDNVIDFTIENLGYNSLDLTANPDKYITLSGTDASDFKVIETNLISSVLGGSSTFFSVKFTPTSLTTSNALLTILSNDTDEGIFTIRLTGAANSSVTSISNNLPFANIKIGPNPLKDQLNIKLNEKNQQLGSVNYQITDIQGRVVAKGRQNVQRGELVIDLYQLRPGSYILTLILGRERIIHRLQKQ